MLRNCRGSFAKLLLLAVHLMRKPGQSGKALRTLRRENPAQPAMSDAGAVFAKHALAAEWRRR